MGWESVGERKQAKFSSEGSSGSSMVTFSSDGSSGSSMVKRHENGSLLKRRGYNGNFLRQWLYPWNHWPMSFGRTSGQFLTRWPEARHLKHLPSFISCALSESVNFLRRVRVEGRNFDCISLDSVAVPAIVPPVETRDVLAAIRFDPRLVLNNCKFMRATRAARMASDNVRGCSRLTSEFRFTR